MLEAQRFITALILILFTISSSHSEERAVRIGVVQSLTGVAASYGESNIRGYSLAAEMINNSRPVRVELVVEDDGTAPANAVSAFRKLKLNNVDAVLGATWDFTTNPLIPIAAEQRLPILCTSTGPEVLRLSEGRGFAFTNWISVEGETAPFADFLRGRNVTSISLMSAPNSWGSALHDAHMKLINERQIKVIDDITTSLNELNDWSAILPRIAAKKPDALVLLVNKGDIELILRRSKELKFSIPMFGTANGADALNDTRDPSLYEGFCFSYPLEQVMRNPDFLDRYKKKFNEPPQKCADTSFDGLVLLYEAVLQARKSGRGVNEVLTETSFPGLAGTYRYSKELSLSTGRGSLVCVHEGKMQLKTMK